MIGGRVSKWKLPLTKVKKSTMKRRNILRRAFSQAYHFASMKPVIDCSAIEETKLFEILPALFGVARQQFWLYSK
eukprot:scaffold175035_cov15-Tisochrysis_lutea.AAC.1